MAGYRNISVSFWTDSKVDDDFTPEDKYFYLYLMTNPHTTICGCYEISMKQMERETGYNTDTVKRVIRRLQESHHVIRYCSETKEILIINWYKYNWPQSQKVRSAVVSVASHIKHEPFKKYVMDMVSIRYGYGMDTTDTVTETESVPETETLTEDSIYSANKSRTRKKFEIPTVEDVESYCRERGNHVDAKAFCDYYESNGWIVGKTAMKDWKAAVRRWERKAARDKPNTLQNASIDICDLENLMKPY